MGLKGLRECERENVLMSYKSWYCELVYGHETESTRITISVISPVLRHVNINNLVYTVRK